MDEMERIRRMLTGETEKEILAKATGVSTGGEPNQYNSTNGQFDIEPGQPPASTAMAPEQETYGPPDAPEATTDPWIRKPEAIKYSRIAQSYKPSTYTEGGVERHTPQQFGQMGTPYDEAEGPRTPIETARELNRIKAEPGGTLGGVPVDGMQKYQAQHTLGFGQFNPERNKAYGEYVQASRLKRDQEKAAQQARAYANREDIADRESRLQNRMTAWNQTVNGMPSSPVDDAPQVVRKGGLTFVSPRFRPLGADEASRVNVNNAQADYMRQRPEMAQRALTLKDMMHGDNVDLKQLQMFLDGTLKGTKLRIDQQNADTKQEQVQGTLGVKRDSNAIRKAMADAAKENMDFDNNLKLQGIVTNEISRLGLLTKIIKAQKEAAAHPGMLGYFKPDQLDRVYDEKTGTLSNETMKGDHQEKINEVKNIVENLAMFDRNIDSLPNAEEVMAIVEDIMQEKKK